MLFKQLLIPYLNARRILAQMPTSIPKHLQRTPLHVPDLNRAIKHPANQTLSRCTISEAQHGDSLGFHCAKQALSLCPKSESSHQALGPLYCQGPFSLVKAGPRRCLSARRWSRCCPGCTQGPTRGPVGRREGTLHWARVASVTTSFWLH